uniref:Fructose-bisphosphate aldolase n=1 Tax=Thermofilum pendens TaxID=2269 RepID=A0A7C4F9J1_THEPE
MSIGKEIRLRKLLRDGKTVIVPIDHPIEGYFKELEDPRRIVQEIIDGGADGVLLRRGTLARTYDLVAGKLAVVYRISGATFTSGDMWDQRILSSVREAVRYAADAIAFTVTVAHPRENDMFEVFSKLVEEADHLGIPVIGEVLVWEKAGVNAFEYLRIGVRALGEEGASIVKTVFPSDFSLYKDLVKYSLVPVVAAGGPKMESPRKVLEFVKAVMDAGAAGTCIGRNTWQHESPSKMVRAMRKIVREGASVEEAMRELL